MINSEKAQGSGGTVLRKAFFCTRARRPSSVMMSSTTGAEAVCAWSLFSQPHLASLLAVEKGFVGHFFSSFSALSFFFVKQTQQHLEPHVFHGHLTIKSRCCQSHKIIVAE